MTETLEKKGMTLITALCAVLCSFKNGWKSFYMTYTQNFRKKFIHWNFFLRNFRDF